MPYTTVKDADNAFSEQCLDHAKIDVYVIIGFVVYCCHGNIDFSKITIITNFSLNPASGDNFTSIRQRKIWQSWLKSCLKILPVGIWPSRPQIIYFK